MNKMYSYCLSKPKVPSKGASIDETKPVIWKRINFILNRPII